MTKWRLRSKRKPTGGLLAKNRKKKRFQRGSRFVETKVGGRKAKERNRRSGSSIVLLSEDKANVKDTAGKVKSVKIVSVTDNPANPHYTRRNVLTKGAVIRTEMGEARVTSSPSRHGVVNAILIGGKDSGKK